MLLYSELGSPFFTTAIFEQFLADHCTRRSKIPSEHPQTLPRLCIVKLL